MGIKAVELRISNYLILFEGKHLTRRQTIAKILHIQLSEGNVCDECDGDGFIFALPKDDPEELNLQKQKCPECKGSGKLLDGDIEYAIKKYQEGMR